MNSVDQFRVKIFADGAEKAGMLEMFSNPLIKGFTTNPSLMRKAGINDYEAFALDILNIIQDQPISFEIFSDDEKESYEQALYISSWGKNVYVKIPVTNTKGESTVNLIRKLAAKGVKQNVTALMTVAQVKEVTQALTNAPSSFISVFAGRIADTGRDPLPIMKEALNIMQAYPQLELIWASTREIFNIFQANEIGCHIITVSNALIKNMQHVGKELNTFSLETVNTFYEDAKNAGFQLELHTFQA